MLVQLRSMILIGLIGGPAAVFAQNEDNLAVQNKRLMEQLEATRTVINVLDARAIRADREKEELAVELRQIQERNVALERELDASLKKTGQSSRTNEQLLTEMEKVRQSHRLRVAELEDKISLLEDESRRPDPADQPPPVDLDTLQHRSGWIAQLLGYHRGYLDATRTPEIDARQEQESKTLTSQLRAAVNKTFEVPNLTSFGMPFVSGYVTSINGAATGRILYQDARGNPLEFWLVQRSGRRSQVYFGENGDLNIVHWAGTDTEFALIGAVAWSDLAPVAGELYQRYGM